MNHIVFKKTKFFSHPIYDNYYCSKEGEIYSKKSNKILKLQKHTAGYFIFNIFEKSKGKSYYAHRYVYECFYGKIPKDKEVDYIDNNKTNNNIKNLQLLTPKENIRKSHCKKLKSYNTKTKEIQMYKSVAKASEVLGITVSSISKVCRKEQKTAKTKDGIIYKFKYIECITQTSR